MESVPSVLDHNDDDFDVLDFEDVSNSSPASIEQEQIRVMFYGSKKSYSLGEDIQIKFYSFNHDHQMEDGDRVGIAPMKGTPFISHKITKATPESCIDIISDDLIEENQITAKQICFRIDELPQEIAGETFFQFCYLNTDGQVIGYSIPFQFSSKNQTSSTPAGEAPVNPSVMDVDVERSQQDDVHMERQEDDDFIVVRTKENCLKESVDHLRKSNNLMQNLVRTSQNELALKTTENRNLIEQIKSYSNALTESRNELETFKKNSSIEKENLKKIHETALEECRHELQNNRLSLIEHKRMIQDRDEQIQALVDQLNGLKVSVSDIKNSNETVQHLQKEIDFVRNDYENYRIKKETEIKDLEDNLRKSVDNLKNMNLKFEMAVEEFSYKEKELKFKLQKEQNLSKSLEAKLEKSKIEYSLVNNRILFYKRKVQDYQNKLYNLRSQSNVETTILPSAPPMVSEPITTIERLDDSTIQHQAATVYPMIVNDEIEARLDDLEREENEKQQKEQELQARNMNLEQSRNNSRNETENLNDSFENEQTIPKKLFHQNNQGNSRGGYVPETFTDTAGSSTQEEYYIQLPCDFCRKTISCKQHHDGSGQMREMIDHLEKEHKQRMCPICSILFDMSLPIFDSYFRGHINDHFQNNKFPDISR